MVFCIKYLLILSRTIQTLKKVRTKCRKREKKTALDCSLIMGFVHFEWSGKHELLLAPIWYRSCSEFTVLKSSLSLSVLRTHTCTHFRLFTFWCFDCFLTLHWTPKQVDIAAYLIMNSPFPLVNVTGFRCYARQNGIAVILLTVWCGRQLAFVSLLVADACKFIVMFNCAVWKRAIAWFRWFSLFAIEWRNPPRSRN